MATSDDFHDLDMSIESVEFTTLEAVSVSPKGQPSTLEEALTCARLLTLRVARASRYLVQLPAFDVDIVANNSRCRRHPTEEILRGRHI
jgi:hypothetical protein